MDDHQLRARLEHLRTELEHTEAVDARGRALLQRLLHEAHALLDRSDPVPAQHYHAVGERLRLAVQQLEEAHPQLTRAIFQVSETLSRMGL